MNDLTKKRYQCLKLKLNHINRPFKELLSCKSKPSFIMYMRRIKNLKLIIYIDRTNNREKINFKFKPKSVIAFTSIIL